MIGGAIQCIVTANVNPQWFFSVVVFGLTITRLNYTLHLPKGDPLNHGADFYGKLLLPPRKMTVYCSYMPPTDPVVAELLVCSLLAFGFAPFMQVKYPGPCFACSSSLIALSRILCPRSVSICSLKSLPQ